MNTIKGEGASTPLKAEQIAANSKPSGITLDP